MSSTPTFYKWARTKLRTILITLIAITTPLIGSTSSLLKLWDNYGTSFAQAGRWIPIFGFGLQLLILMVLLFVIVRAPVVDKEAYPQASDAVEKFHSFWVFLWTSWMFLYLFALIKSLLIVNGHDWIKNPMSYILWNFLANMANLFCILCYVVLSNRTDEKPTYFWIPGIAIILVAALLEVMLVLYVGSPAPRVVSFVYGMIGGVSLAMFVGRLESKFIAPPAGIIILLYSYAVLQVGAAFFIHADAGDAAEIHADAGDATEAIGLLLTSIALLLKFVLFIFVYWLLSTGRLLYYMHRVRELEGESDIQIQAFLNSLRGSKETVTES